MYDPCEHCKFENNKDIDCICSCEYANIKAKYNKIIENKDKPKKELLSNLHKFLLDHTGIKHGNIYMLTMKELESMITMIRDTVTESTEKNI